MDIVNWKLRNKLPWNFNRNSYIFIQENELKCRLKNEHEHDTRSACLNHINIQFNGNTRVQKAFSYSGAYIWNSILSHIVTDCAICIFQKHCTALLNSKRTSKTVFRPTWIVSMLMCRNVSAYFHNMKELLSFSLLEIYNNMWSISDKMILDTIPLHLHWCYCTNIWMLSMILGHISYCFLSPLPCTIPFIFWWRIAECNMLMSYYLNVHHMYYMAIKVFSLSL